MNRNRWTLPISDCKTINDFNVQSYTSAMMEHGRHIVQFHEPIDVISLVKKIGKTHSHDAAGSLLWNVKPQMGNEREATRSLTSLAFPLHTDCSYEETPPTHFVLFVVQDDAYGGGESILVDFSKVYPRLSAEIIGILKQPYRVKVPKEFMKSQTHASVPIVIGKGLLRYRREIIEEAYCTAEQVSALNILDEYLAKNIYTLNINIPKYAALFLDNRRFLHARTAIRDNARHLQRVRYFSK